MNTEEKIREAIHRFNYEPPLSEMSDSEWAAYRRGIDDGMACQRRISRESGDIILATIAAALGKANAEPIEGCGAVCPGCLAICTKERGHEGQHGATVGAEAKYHQWDTDAQ